MSGASHRSAEYDDEGDSWCADSVGVRTMCLRGDLLRDFWGEQERLLRGEEGLDGVPPRRRAAVGKVGSVLGMCVSWSLSAGPSFWAELKGGKGSEEGAGDGPGVPPSAKPLANASLRLSGEGWTWRIVERVLYAVLGRSGDAGAVRGRMCVARILSGSCVGTAVSTGRSSGEGGAVAGKPGDSLGGELAGYGGSGDNVGEEKFWRMAKRRCRRWCNGEWLICFLSLVQSAMSFVVRSCLGSRSFTRVKMTDARPYFAAGASSAVSCTACLTWLRAVVGLRLFLEFTDSRFCGYTVTACGGSCCETVLSLPLHRGNVCRFDI